MSLVLLIGGARAGKSALAVELASSWNGEVTFLATAEGRDDEMAERIARHREQRPADWTTVDEPLELRRRRQNLCEVSEITLDICVIRITLIRMTNRFLLLAGLLALIVFGGLQTASAAPESAYPAARAPRKRTSGMNISASTTRSPGASAVVASPVFRRRVTPASSCSFQIAASSAWSNHTPRHDLHTSSRML